MLRGRCIAAAIGCLLALSGCSVLSGRTASEPTASGSNNGSSRPTSAKHAAFTSPHQVAAVLAAAEHDFELVSTYDYRNLSKYLHAGLAVTTGSFSDTYRKGLTGQAATGIRAAHVVQVATAHLSALIGLQSDVKAIAVVRGSIITTTAGNATGTTKTITAVLHLQRSGHTWRISKLTTGAAAHGSVPANADLRAAIATVTTTIGRIYGLHRAHFAKLFQRALDLTTDDLRATLFNQEDSIRQRLIDGAYDVSSKITGLAVVRARGAETEFLVAIDEYRITRQGAKLGPYPHLLDVTATGESGAWLLSSAAPVS